jgi:hypothetical protein
MAKYFLSVWDLRRASTRGGADAPPWEAKSTYNFYIELVTGMHEARKYMLNPDLVIRLCQAYDILDFFRRHHDVLWPPAQYHPGCLHHWPLFHHSSHGLLPLSDRYTGHGP